jgi:membrane dipeptidase
MFLIDAHLDISINAIEWNRDYRKTVHAIREMEKGMTDKIDRAKGTVALPDLRRGNIGLVVATQLARYNKENGQLPGAGWNSQQQAWAMSQGQVAWYQAMEAEGEMVLISNLAALEKHIALWMDESLPNNKKPVGYILSLEGADSMINLSYVEKAYNYGLRIIGPAHYGPGRYASGTGTTGGLTDIGKDLLKEMDRLNMILDATHLTDKGFTETMDLFKGPGKPPQLPCTGATPAAINR